MVYKLPLKEAYDKDLTTKGTKKLLGVRRDDGKTRLLGVREYYLCLLCTHLSTLKLIMLRLLLRVRVRHVY